MSLSFSSIVSSIDAHYGDTSRGAFTKSKLLEYTNSEARMARVFFDLPTAEYTTQLPVWNGVYTYPAPSGYKGFISLLQNFYTYDDSDVTHVTNFWSDLTGRNIVGDQRQGNTRSILVRIGTPTLGNYILNNCNTFDGNGTWTAFGDASNVQTNQQYVHAGNGSVSFDLTYATGTGGIFVSNMQAVDLSGVNIKNIGSLFAWLFLPSFAGYTSVNFQWGSDASNYWSQTATAQQGGAALVAGWQPLGYAWASATKVGTPNAAQVKFLRLTLNFPASMPVQTGVSLDDVWMRQQLLMNLTYSSDYLVQDTAGVLYEEFADFNTSADWVLNIPKEFKDWVVFRVLKRAFVFVKPSAMSVSDLSSELQRIENELYTAYPSKKKLPIDNYYEAVIENPVADLAPGAFPFTDATTANWLP